MLLYCLGTTSIIFMISFPISTMAERRVEMYASYHELTSHGVNLVRKSTLAMVIRQGRKNASAVRAAVWK